MYCNTTSTQKVTGCFSQLGIGHEIGSNAPAYKTKEIMACIAATAPGGHFLDRLPNSPVPYQNFMGLPMFCSSTTAGLLCVNRKLTKSSDR